MLNGQVQRDNSGGVTDYQVFVSYFMLQVSQWDKGTITRSWYWRNYDAGQTEWSEAATVPAHLVNEAEEAYRQLFRESPTARAR